MSTQQLARERVGALWFTLFTVAWILIWSVQLTPLQLLLPLQLDSASPGGAGGGGAGVGASDWVRGVVSSGLVLGIGGLAGVIAGPLAGALSDRSLRAGRLDARGTRSGRCPWALGGIWLAALCLVFTGSSSGALAIGASWVGVCVGTAVASAALTAMIADQLPIEQRGAAASAASSAQALAIVLGVGTVVLLGLGVLAGYLTLAVTLAVVGSAAVLLLPDRASAGRIAAARDAPSARAAADRFAALRDRDFRWLLTGRLVVNLGNSLGTSLFLFFLLYGVGQAHDEAEDNLLLVVVVYTVFVVAASVLSGLVTDRTGRRKRLAVLSPLVQAVAGALLVFSPTFGTTLIAAAIMGVGFGAFSTVGLALATVLLPSEQDRARDLGLVNTSAALGQLLGPVIGALLVALVGGFWLVYAIATVLSLLGSLLTSFVRERSVP